MNSIDSVIEKACIGFSKSMDLCYKEHENEMRQMRRRFFNRLGRRIAANVRVHQMNLMNTIEMLYINEFEKKKPAKKSSYIWKKAGTGHWWNSIIDADDDTWIQLFRMNKDTFFFICETLADEFKPKSNFIREAVPMSTKIAAALYKLATNEPYLSIGDKFGIHKISAYNAFYQFCEACTKVLQSEQIAIPEGEEISDVIQQFEQKVDLPQLLGAMDGTKISISPRAMGFAKHMREKGTKEIVLQAIVDSNCLFRDVSLLEETKDFIDYKAYIEQRMSKMLTKGINCMAIPVYLTSRRTDSVQPWIMKPYANVLTPEEELFNDYLGESSVFAEQALRRLKGRWKILQEPLNLKVSFIPNVLMTCCILHNILEDSGVEYDSSLDADLASDDLLYSGPQDVTEERSILAEVIRDHLKDYKSCIS